MSCVKGGAVAEWSKALLERESINENQKDPRFAPPGLGKLLQNQNVPWKRLKKPQDDN